MANLADAYIAGNPEVVACLGGPPEAVWSRALLTRPWADGLAQAVHAYNAQLGNECPVTGDEPVVVTGQQPGIFTGPLYTVYKAITCIGLARQLSELHNRTVLPVFWVGSEDHDFEEARTVCALTKDHAPLELSYDPEAEVVDMPMHAVPVEPQLHVLADAMARAVPGSEFTPAITAMLHETLDEADSLADWCARLLARLFHETPLVLFAPHLHEARRAAVEVMRQAIEHPRQTTHLLNDGGLRVEQLGYPAQIVKAPEECAFFLMRHGRRRKVIHDGGNFLLPGEENARLTAGELLELLDREPESFSPNVALRCIVQQALFPTLAYVAGPGEMAYWAQMKDVFTWYRQPMPVVYPRARACISTIKVNRLRAELGINRDNLYHSPEELVGHALRDVNKSPALEVIGQYQEFFAAAAAAMAEALDTTARHETAQAARKFSDSLSNSLNDLARREALADETHAAAVRARVARVCATLAPQRKPQERVYTVFSFLFQHGPALLPRLMDTLDIRDFTMQEIEL
jgi:bacillithiol biosynthesis cysteine-adding enzyme BshC